MTASREQIDFSKIIFSKTLTSEFLNILQTNICTLNKCLEDKNLNAHNLLLTLDDMDSKIRNIWAPLKSISATAPKNDLTQTLQEISMPLSKYATLLGQNRTLYNKILHFLTKQDIVHKLDKIQVIALKKSLLSFELSGIHLSEETQEYYKGLQHQHIQLMQTFEKNLLNDNNNYRVDLIEELVGLPSEFVHYATKVNLQLPLVENVFKLILSHTNSRQLRHNYYLSYSNLASNNNSWNNTKTVMQIIGVRKNIARTIGYNNYVEFIMQNMSIKSSKLVLNILHELTDNILEKVLFELAKLTKFAKELDGIYQLKSWDIEYYSRLYNIHHLGLVDAEIKEYFPLAHVFNELLKIFENMFKCTFIKENNVDLWHSSVHSVIVYNNSQNCIGIMYFDLFSREQKKQGSWTEIFSTSHLKLNNLYNTPIVAINCNFRATSPNENYLLSMEDLRILLHEFGHALHHIFSQNDYSIISGMSSLSLDTNEVPSLFFEQWCWQKEILERISQHYKTQAPLPENIVTSLQTYKQFPNAVRLLQRTVRAIYDIELHTKSEQSPYDILQTLLKNKKIPEEIVDFNINSFSLIFSQGYGGRYFSYIWSEIIASGILEVFQREGFFSPETTKQFVKCFMLGSIENDVETAHINFCNKKPTISSLINQRCI